MWRSTLKYFFLAMAVSSVIAAGIGVAAANHCSPMVDISGDEMSMSAEMQMDICHEGCLSEDGGCSMQTSCADIAVLLDLKEAAASYKIQKYEHQLRPANSVIVSVVIPPPRLV